MVTDLTLVCDALRQERVDRKISLDLVCELGRLDKSSLSKYERGLQTPKAETVQRWAGVFGYKLCFSLQKAIVEVER